MELHEIRYFLALSKTLNFTKAAEICNVSQPALTRAIQKMEDELGGLLFSRERNNTHLTELGRLLEPHLTEVQDAHPGGKGDRDTLPAARQRAASAGRDVHHRAGAVRQLPQPVSCRQSRRGDHAGRSGARPVVRSAVEGRTRRGTPGEAGWIRIAATAAAALSGAVRDRLLRRPCVRAEERGAHRRPRRAAVSGADQLRILRRAARRLPRQRLTSGRLVPQRARGLDSDHGRRGHGRSASCRNSPTPSLA